MNSSPRELIPLQLPGRFTIGCNYWASHAGTAMWRDWRPEIIEADFAKLAASGLEVLRIFPLWPDFQPIVQLRGQGGSLVEIRLGPDEQPLPHDPVGQAGVSAVMLSRFTTLCELAARHNLKLIVGLVTGWMSGRLFVPPALESLNPITDATSIAWQTKLVRAIVRHTRHHPAIQAWDLGNECNCMGAAVTRDAAYLWTAAITNAIRATDATRPVISGMHSLATPTCNVPNAWTIDDQGDLTDILTTHPYPYWTRHTRNDPVNTFRTSLHATAETRFYADIGGKPCFAEEIGTMGPMIAGDRVSADFARINLLSLWANDCRGFLWWCSHDQTHLTHAPYDWIGVELELGLIRSDGTQKPVLDEMGGFHRFLDSLPFTALPPRRTDAICLLTHNQDAWAVAFGSFVLAKQAKLEIAFRHIHQEIPESPVYLLPSLQGANCVPLRVWRELIARVRRGATLYLSLGDGILPHFNEIAGVELVSRGKPRDPLIAAFNDTPDSPLHLTGGDTLDLVATTAEVLASRIDNQQPAFWRNRVGEGLIYVFAAPIESTLSHNPGSFCPGSPAYWRLYQSFAASAAGERWINVASPDLAVTEHEFSPDRAAVVIINHTGRAIPVTTPLKPGALLGAQWRGTAATTTEGALEFTVPAHDACILELIRQKA
ncbi:MAG: cellulase family glycosylhydrolase [Opitutaceae bacterium]|nr:cellulase family glycosylhydrolase [Opitutaceae bacterium]